MKYSVDTGQNPRFQYLQLEIWLQNGYNPTVLARQIPYRRFAKCSILIATLTVILIAALSGRSCAGYAALAADSASAVVTGDRFPNRVSMAL